VNKVIYSIMLVFLCINLSAEEKKKTADFRKTRWKMTMVEVLKAEKAQFTNKIKNYLCYKTAILNKDCLITYLFYKGKLLAARYYFTSFIPTKEFNLLEAALKAKYGGPSDIKVALKKLYDEYFYLKWIKFSKSVELRSYIKWNDTRTDIYLMLFYNKKKEHWNTSIRYICREYAQEYKKN